LKSQELTAKADTTGARMKRILLLTIISAAALLGACGGPPPSPPDTPPAPSPAPVSTPPPATPSPAPSPTPAGAGGLVGISMPAQGLLRWNQEGATLKSQLEAMGYRVDLRFAAGNDTAAQAGQIGDMIGEGCKALVVTAADASALAPALEGAKARSIPVIAYDHFILNTDAVTYFVAFDNYKAGALQGQFIADALGPGGGKTGGGPYNIELVSGDPGDGSAALYWEGAMSALRPRIDGGSLNILSGQATQAQCAAAYWSVSAAQSRMAGLIASNHYGPGGARLDAVLCPNDTTALGVTNALLSAGYSAGNMPVVTGLGCDKPSVRNIAAGIQSMSVFDDIRILAGGAASVADALISGRQREISGAVTVNNGASDVPALLLSPLVVTRDNYMQILVGGGYYDASDLE